MFTPQPEPAYKLTFNRPSDFNDLKKYAHLIIVAAKRNDSNSGFRLIKKLLPEHQSHNSKDDNPLYLGHGATISAPHMHAYALEYLTPHIKDKSNILDVGSGSGYLTSCLARMTPNGKAFGIEHIDDLIGDVNQALS